MLSPLPLKATFADYPHFTPLPAHYVLAEGVFGGNYFHDADMSFIAEISHRDFDLGILILHNRQKYASPQRNALGVLSGASRQQWIDAGFMTPDSPLGWFQWFVRFSTGHRIPQTDEHHISRWQSFGARHGAQVLKNGNADPASRPVQRQALLQWAHDPYPDMRDTPRQPVTLQACN